ncbi:RtcB family protein [Leptolyngbya sp. FACHB-16]|jgi:hypothetical protein|uniref:RtcB family protein n=1 Tax=unclassified Leptolyngbya TaxID=2650499 RepID=UPI00241187EB|nr:RtcB family protein [Leptolyngbya sp. FACHB-16]
MRCSTPLEPQLHVGDRLAAMQFWLLHKGKQGMPIDQVMANQSDLVEVVATLKQLVCVKG